MAKRKKRIHKNEDSIRNLWDNFKHNNIHILGAPEGEEREQETEHLCKRIMMDTFPNLAKETYKSRKHRESQTR